MALPNTSETVEASNQNTPNIDLNALQANVLQSQRVLDETLAKQMGREPDIWQSLAAFGRPTHSGSLAESGANFVDEYNKQKQDIESKIPSIAQMRSQLGAQTLKTAQEVSDNNLLQQYKSENPALFANLESSLASGKPLAENDMQKLKSLSLLTHQGTDASTKLEKQFNMADKLATQSREDLKLNKDIASFGLDVTKFKAQFGDEAFDMLPQSTKNLLQQNENKPPPSQTQSQETSQEYPEPKPLNITSDYGHRTLNGKNEFHTGVDIPQPIGVGVHPMQDGKVFRVEKNPDGFGNRVVVDHGDKTLSYYAHMNDINVKEGDAVTPSTYLGTTGNTGRTTGPHMEFGVIKDGQHVDPKPYLKDKNIFAQFKAPVSTATNTPIQVASAGRYEGMGLPLEAKQKLVVADVERINKKLDEVPDLLSKANKQIIVGNTLYNTIKGNEDAFGILRQNPSTAKAIANYLESGIKVGNFQAGFPIEEAVRKSLPKIQQEAIQKVESLLNQIAIQTAGEMKGSVSNYEDKMVKSVYGTPSNSAEFLKYIANKVKIEGQYQKDLIDRFSQINAERPMMTYTQFILSKEAKKMEQQFQQAVEMAGKTSAKRMGIKDIE
jgi:murein DD-endopeptidase MepM/ murein hydrolase activator NlpD